MLLQLNQPQKGIPLKPADACSNCTRNSISKWAQCLVGWSSHWQFTSSDSLKELYSSWAHWCQIYSEKSWSCLVFPAPGSKLGLGCSQNQFCAALLSYKQLHEKKQKSDIFWAYKQGCSLLSIHLEKQIFQKNVHLFSASCTSLRSYMIRVCQHKSDSGRHSVHRQHLIDWDVSKRSTTSSYKMSGLVERKLCRVMLVYAVHSAASWNNRRSSDFVITVTVCRLKLYLQACCINADKDLFFLYVLLIKGFITSVW